jgi:hypothetical protein
VEEIDQWELVRRSEAVDGGRVRAAREWLEERAAGVHYDGDRLRGSASRLRSAARSAFPSVVSPAATEEPAYGNDNPAEGKPEVY